MSDLGTDWSITYTSGNGVWVPTADGDAVWSLIPPGGVRESVCRYVPSTSTDDYQIVGVLLSSAATCADSYTGFNDVWGRLNATGDAGVRFRFGGDASWSVAAVTSTSTVVMAAGTDVLRGPANALQLYCGDRATTTLRRFKVFAGSTLLADFTDTTSQYGSGFRSWGMGCRVEGALYSGTQMMPGGVRQFFAQDQP